MDCNWSGSSVHGIFPGKDTGVGDHFLLQGVFLIQGSNLHLLSPALASGVFTTEPPGSPRNRYTTVLLYESKCGLLYPKYFSRIVSSFYRYHQVLVHYFSQIFYYFNLSSYLNTSHLHQSTLFKKEKSGVAIQQL